MITLILAVLFSALIFIIFRVFERFEINIFQAVVFNYITAFGVGILLYGHEWNSQALTQISWLPFAVLSAVLFISLFVIMGVSSQKNGVSSTSLSVKMSMALSLILIMFWYDESVTLLKVIGILIAFISVYLISSFEKNGTQDHSTKWMLIVLFLGSGVLDFVLNYVQAYHLMYLSPALFSAFGFGIAFLIGFCYLLVQIFRKKMHFQWKNLIAGLILGIPNYFSIFLLIKAYKTTSWSDSTVLAINNVCVVSICSIAGYFLFKEGMTMKKQIGLLLSISSIILLYFANFS